MELKHVIFIFTNKEAKKKKQAIRKTKLKAVAEKKKKEDNDLEHIIQII